jgi:hypothetical protein
MTLRHVLCEGPDDLTALREIALYAFGAQIERAPAQVSAGGEARQAILRTGNTKTMIIVGRGGKTRLPVELAADLAQLPPQMSPQDEAAVEMIAVVFDPDGDPEETFHKEIEAKVADAAPGWSLSPEGAGAWIATRGAGERVGVRAIPWRAPGGVVDGLADHRNLERVLCAVLVRAYPGEAQIVGRWLTEIHAQGRAPGWKAALHLWCALVKESANELNAAAQFLRQDKACKPHSLDVLREVGLLADLQPLFS